MFMDEISTLGNRPYGTDGQRDHGSEHLLLKIDDALGLSLTFMLMIIKVRWACSPFVYEKRKFYALVVFNVQSTETR